MEMQTFEDLFYMEIQELYDVEARLIKALDKMAKAAQSGRLREAFNEHKEETKEHHARLEEIFRDIGRARGSKAAEGIQGLIEEGEKVVSELEQSALRDALLVAAGNRVEHYEIASYGTAVAHAHLLGYTQSATLLEKTLDEEKATDARLSRIAETLVNREALQLGAHQHV